MTINKTLLLSWVSMIKPTAQNDLSVDITEEIMDDDYPKRLHNLSTQMTPGSSSTPWGMSKNVPSLAL